MFGKPKILSLRLILTLNLCSVKQRYISAKPKILKADAKSKLPKEKKEKTINELHENRSVQARRAAWLAALTPPTLLEPLQPPE